MTECKQKSKCWEETRKELEDRFLDNAIKHRETNGELYKMGERIHNGKTYEVCITLREKNDS